MRKLRILFFLHLFFYAAAYAQPNYETQIAEFEKFVKVRMAADQVPGLSVGFMKDGRIWSNGYGYADLENKSPAKAESMYRMASVTKPMTAMAVLRLVDEGKIDLDAEVQTYVPYFPKKNYPVTVRRVLGHLGGISHYRDYDKEGHFKNYMDTQQSLAVFQDFDLVSEPGTRYFYSSYGYNLLGAVIEGASGMKYADYMRKNVWDPLDMKTIRMDSLTELIPNRPRGYAIENNGLQNSETIDISSRFAAGGTRATVIDMLRFGKGIVDRKVLKNETLGLMTESMATKSGAMTFYGAGLSTFPVNGRYMLQHSGAQAETSTLLMIFPSRDLVLAIGMNLEGTSGNPYLTKLFELITGEAWDQNVYINDGNEKVPLMLAMQAVFEQGRASYEKTGYAVPNFPDSIKAFAGFNEHLNKETLVAEKKDELVKEVMETRLVKNGPLEKIGQYMAYKLVSGKGAEHMHEYSNGGAIEFFDEYMRLDNSGNYKFNEAVTAIVRKWRASWDRTNTTDMRSLDFNASSDFSVLGADLKKRFGNEAVYPNFSSDIVSLLQPMAIAGKNEQVLEAAKIAVELYPDIEPAVSNYGFYLVLYGQNEKGIGYLRRGAKMNPNGFAGIKSLSDIAKDVVDFGLIDAGLNVIEVAIEVHPESALLRDTAARIYMLKGEKARALSSFKKALELEPDYAGVAAVKIEIDRLQK